MSVRCILTLLALWGAVAAPAWSQEQIYRCGNEYTNDLRLAQRPGCVALEGLAVTVVPGTRVMRADAAQPVVMRSSAAATPASPATPAGPASAEARSETRIDAAQQRARDADARLILETELRKAEARLAQMQAEFNNGEPDKQGIEGRNHQRYLDRVQSMREALVRQQTDVTSLRRELARLPGGSTVASKP